MADKAGAMEAEAADLQEDLGELNIGDMIDGDEIVNVIDTGDDDGPPPSDDDDDDEYDEGGDTMDGEADGAGAMLYPDTDDSVLAFTAHSETVFTVATSAVGNVAASGGEDDTAFVWDLATGETKFECKGHEDSVICVKFNRDGSLLATGSMDGIIKVWKTESGEEALELDCGDDLTWLDWHPVANFIIAGTDSGSMYMWDVPGANMSFFSGHSATVSCGGWAPDGRNFLSGGDDAALVLWSPKTGSVINKLHGSTFNLSHDTGIVCAGWHPEGGTVASGDGDGTVNISHPKNGKLLKSFKVADGSVESIGLSCGKPTKCASGTMDGLLVVHDVATGIQLQCFEHTAGVVQVLWHRTEANLVYTCALDGIVREWNVATKEVKEFTGHKAHVLGFAISADNTKLVSCGEDNKCLVFDIDKVTAHKVEQAPANRYTK